MTNEAHRPLAIFSRGMTAHAGGLEIFNANLVTALGNRVPVFVAPPDRSSRLRDYASRLTKTLRFLRRNKGADVLVQYGSFLDILALPLLRLASDRVRVIAHVSDTWVHIRRPSLFALTKLILKTCARQLFVLADQQAKVFGDLRPTKIHTIISSAFAETPSQPSRRGFAFLGRVVREKGVFDLLAAWADPRIQQRGLKLRLYGPTDPEMLARIEAEIARLKLGETVRIAGPAKGDAAVIQTIDGAEAILYPTYADAFPLVMLESFARGTPCLVSTVGEGQSFVDNPELVVSPGDITGIADAVIKLAGGHIAQSYLDAMQAKARRYARGAIVSDLAAHGALTLGAPS